MNVRQYIVVGLGRFGISLAQTLYDSGAEVMAIDLDADLVDEVQNSVTHAVQADATDLDALTALGVRNFDVAVITIGSDIRASGVATMLMKELGVKMVVAKAHDDMHGRLLSKLGADKVVFPERDMGRRVAHNLVSGNILNYIEVSPDYSMIEIQPLRAWTGRSLMELDLRKRYAINVIAIRRGTSVNATPRAEDKIQEGDVLLVLGSHEGLEQLEREG